MKPLSIIYKTALCAAAIALTACSNIDDDDRLIYVKPAQVNRAVLIEDFTGQRCVNCPKATDEIHTLQQQYGDSVVIAVGIHSGSFGKYASGRPTPLYTETGQEYFDHWGITAQPMGLVNRQNGPMVYQAWGALTRAALETKSDVAISLSNSYDSATRSLTINTTVKAGADINGKLQLWVIEDGIQSFQYQPDGSSNREYIHSHVFRAAVNGTWGEDLSVAEGYSKSTTHTLTLDESWNAQNVSIVAFVYNGSGVLNVTKASATGAAE